MDGGGGGYLGDPYPGDPEIHGPGVVAAQVLDVLGLLLDLRMLEKQGHDVRDKPHPR